MSFSALGKRFFSSTSRSLAAISNYSKFLTEVAQARTDSPIRALQPLIRMPGVLSLGGGNPNAEVFPFESVDVKLKDGANITIGEDEVKDALQYTYTQGYPPFCTQISSFMKRLYNPVQGDDSWSNLVTSGSQDGLSRVFESILDDSSSLIVEDPIYPGAVAALQSLPGHRLSVACDKYGMIPEELEALLDAQTPSDPMVKAIYTIPTGQNPSGATMPTDRKKKIYEICSKHDILIIEDDPYALLSLPPLSEPHPGTVLKPEATFFGMDTEGRVVRLDSLSKIISSGLRIGWVTAHPDIIRPINRHIQATSLHTSTLIQAVVARMLEHWGSEGFDKHIIELQKFYTERRNWFEESALKHLEGYANWDTPEAGLFFWLEIAGVNDTEHMIHSGATDKKVVCVPGKACTINSKASPWVRCAYSNCSREELDSAVARLGELIKEVRFHARDEEF